MAHLETFTVRIVDGPSSLFTFLSGFDCVLAASCPSEDSALPEVRAALANFVAQSVVASYGVDLGRDACANLLVAAIETAIAGSSELIPLKMIALFREKTYWHAFALGRFELHVVEPGLPVATSTLQYTLRNHAQSMGKSVPHGDDRIGDALLCPRPGELTATNFAYQRLELKRNQSFVVHPKQMPGVASNRIATASPSRVEELESWLLRFVPDMRPAELFYIAVQST